MTLNFFKSTRAQDTKTTPGRLTMHQVIEMHDALTGIYVCCCHVLNGNTDRYESKLEMIGETGKLSIAHVQRILKTWYKWTWYRDNGSEVPTVSQVQSFLSEVN